MALVVLKREWYCTKIGDSRTIGSHSGRKSNRLVLTCSYSFKAQRYLERDRFKTVKKKVFNFYKWLRC